jgi:response regulator RpfG family c-di-GMP phosphodiesterase
MYDNSFLYFQILISILDKSLLLLGILSEYYTGAARSRKSILADYVKAFGTFLGFSNNDIGILVKASYFLDVGSIFLRKESGTARFQEEPMHPIVSADFARLLLETERLAEIILHHHDRWDGQGRFNKAKGEEIPLGSRIIAILDYFVRALANGKDEMLALDSVSKNAGTFFDPNLVEKFSVFLKKREGIVRNVRNL